jgi:hypothetical protein
MDIIHGRNENTLPPTHDDHTGTAVARDIGHKILDKERSFPYNISNEKYSLLRGDS